MGSLPNNKLPAYRGEKGKVFRLDGEAEGVEVSLPVDLPEVGLSYKASAEGLAYNNFLVRKRQTDQFKQIKHAR